MAQPSLECLTLENELMKSALRRRQEADELEEGQQVQVVIGGITRQVDARVIKNAARIFGEYVLDITGKVKRS